MKAACMREFDQAKLVVMSAAVADFKPKSQVNVKIRKEQADMELELVPTDDILAGMGARKRSGQTIVGFALETDDELARAADKLKRKNLDFLVLNSLRDAGAGFSFDTNKITSCPSSGEWW